jgi:hypothetical protein
VDDFIKVYRATLAYAKVDKNEIPVKNDQHHSGQPNVGSFVQWTSGGVDQFAVPRRVVGIEGEWAFIEGSPTGMPMSELTLQDPPANPPLTPPANPYYSAQRDRFDDEADQAFAAEQTKLDEGLVRMSLPDTLSAESIEELEYWLHGVLRRACRRAGIDPDPKKRGDVTTNKTELS